MIGTTISDVLDFLAGPIRKISTDEGVLATLTLLFAKITVGE